MGGKKSTPFGTWLNHYCKHKKIESSTIRLVWGGKELDLKACAKVCGMPNGSVLNIQKRSEEEVRKRGERKGTDRAMPLPHLSFISPSSLSSHRFHLSFEVVELAFTAAAKFIGKSQEIQVRVCVCVCACVCFPPPLIVSVSHCVSLPLEG